MTQVGATGTTDSTVLHVNGGVLVGPDDVREDLWVIDGRISFSPPTSSAQVQTVRGWVVPGLVDAHCHVGLEAHGAVDDDRAKQHAVTDRAAGALLLRDAGSPADTRWIQGRDDLPKLIRAGRHIARTRRYLRNFAWEVEPEQLVEQVRIEARAGDGWVKIVGDWIDRDAGDLLPCWPADVLVEAVAAAHQEGARITAHCFAEQSLRDLAAAGVDCIEHATGLQDDTIETFAAQGISIVPTLVNIDQFPQLAGPAREKFPTYYAHMIDLYDRRLDTVRAAHEAGVPIRLGTDAGGSLPHGLQAKETLRLQAAGLSATEVLDAATWGSRAWLGHPGLEEGADADLLVLSQDPRESLEVLGHPDLIVLRGRAFDG